MVPPKQQGRPPLSVEKWFLVVAVAMSHWDYLTHSLKSAMSKPLSNHRWTGMTVLTTQRRYIQHSEDILLAVLKVVSPGINITFGRLSLGIKGCKWRAWSGGNIAFGPPCLPWGNRWNLQECQQLGHAASNSVHYDWYCKFGCYLRVYPWPITVQVYSGKPASNWTWHRSTHTMPAYSQISGGQGLAW